MGYLIGIDLGTSATKTVLFDESLREVCSVSREYPMAQPKNGWAEQNPEDWWTAAWQTVKEALAKSGIDPAQVKGVGIAGQMHGMTLMDEKGRVLRPAII